MNGRQALDRRRLEEGFLLYAVLRVVQKFRLELKDFPCNRNDLAKSVTEMFYEAFLKKWGGECVNVMHYADTYIHTYIHTSYILNIDHSLWGLFRANEHNHDRTEHLTTTVENPNWPEASKLTIILQVQLRIVLTLGFLDLKASCHLF